MRSRYSAFVRGDAAWLLATWHPETRPDGLDLTTEPQPQWLGLTIQSSPPPAPGEDTATVHFVARYKLNGRAHRLEEISGFRRSVGRWFYHAGDVKDD